MSDVGFVFMEKPKHIHLLLLPILKRRAVTIYPFIFWSKKYKGWENPCLVAHEMYHWNDQKRWKDNKRFGLLRWLVKFVFQWFWFNLIRYFPRDKHPMEKIAHEIQRQCEKGRVK